MSEPSQFAEEVKDKPLQPGMVYGIIALLCGLEPFVYIFFRMLYMLHFGLLSPWQEINCVLRLISPFCAIAGLIFGIIGIKGRKTQGRLFAYIGLSLSLLYFLLLVFVVFFLIVLSSGSP